jgi:hypothetical protein
LAGSIEDIGSAPDPSAAIQVYVGAPDRSNLDVEHAYVRRMEQLGTPELADSQAKDVVARDPKDSVGWATIAESDAKRGKMPEALSAISNIAGLPTDDPIVLGASGRLIAWYQNFGATVQIDPNVKQRIDDLSRQLADKPAYADALNKAKDAYSRQNAQQPGTVAPNNPAGAAAQNTTPAPSAPAQAAPTAQSSAPVQQPIYQPGNGTPVQVNPGPYGGTPVQAPPPQTVTSGDVNVPQQREYVSGDAVYQGSPYPTYSGTATYSAPSYVDQPVYVPPPTYYYYDPYPYYSSPYYYGPDVYIYGGFGRGFHHDFHDFHDFHDHGFDHGFDRGHFDHGHMEIHGETHGGFDRGGIHDGGMHDGGGHFDGHGGGGGGASHGGGGGGQHGR